MRKISKIICKLIIKTNYIKQFILDYFKIKIINTIISFFQDFEKPFNNTLIKESLYKL